MQPKSGIKTSEAWLTIATLAGSVLALVQGVVPENSVWAIILGAVATVVTYIISRMRVKESSVIEE